MRRRINTFETVSDDTARPHLYLNRFHDDKGIQLDDPPLALYDDELWQELKAAQAKLREVESRVSAAAVEEPLDAVEVRLGGELWDMLHGQYNQDRWDEIERELVAHAATVERKP